MPIYSAGKNSNKLPPFEAYKRFLKAAKTMQPALNDDDAKLIARLWGYALEDGTDMPIAERNRWAEMRVLGIDENGKKCIVFPDDWTMEDFDIYLIPLWFHGFIDMTFDEDKKVTRWQLGPNGKNLEKMKTRGEKK